MPVIDTKLEEQMSDVARINAAIRRLKEAKETRVRMRKVDVLWAPKYSASEPTYSPKKPKKPVILTDDNVLGTITYTKNGIRITGSPSSPDQFSPGRFGVFSPASSDKRRQRDATYSPYSPIGPGK